MTEHQLFLALRALYPAAEYALLPQVANGTGSRANRHADALALSLWPSRGLSLSGFEMKSYRGDWIRELRNPAKAEEIAQYCNFWWIVAGGPFVQLDELPEGWGLLAWDPEKKALKKQKQAIRKDAVLPDLPFIAAMLRKAQEFIGPEAETIKAKEEAFLKGKEAGQVEAKYALERYATLQKTVGDFEKASGIKLTHNWRGGKAVGDAVNVVLNGTIGHEKNQLRRLAKQILKDLGEAEEE